MTLSSTSSTPSFSEFDPTIIPYQDQVIDDVINGYDYSYGVHEFLLSGSVGSAKSVLLAHLGIMHSLKYVRARGAIVRKAMPDLKATLFKKMNEHMEGCMVEGTHYWVNHTTGMITFKNGSEIICRSWSDRKYMKLRSLELSWAIVEELTENDEEDSQGYLELKMRVGRLPHIRESWIGSACNPDSPSHWVYEYFQMVKDEGLQESGLSPLGLGLHGDRMPTKHVYYSRTADNPFLPDSYKDQLKSDLDPKMYERMGLGRWIEIKSEGIYHQYDRAHNYVAAPYTIDPKIPIILTWDFNIGEGKPLSVAVCQFTGTSFHVFNEVVIEGMRTEESLEELAGRGILDLPVPGFIVCGDASGKHRDTRSRRSDYDIIMDFLVNYKTKEGKRLSVEKNVPLANPPIRDRHNLVNAYLCNTLGERRMFVYQDAPTADKAMRLTKLRDTGHYIEDDDKPYQHLGTAIGYALWASVMRIRRQPQRTIQL